MNNYDNGVNNNQFSEQNVIKGLYSWPVIILAFIFFWPLGIYLVIARTTKSRKETFTAWKRIRTIGWVLVVIGILFSAVYISEPDDNLMVGLVIAMMFLIGGFFTLKSAKKQKINSEQYKTYILLVVNSNIEDLATIASKMGVEISEAIEDLGTMIAKGYLGSFVLDLGNSRIYNVNAERERQLEKERNTRVVICSNGCGASNLLTEKVGKCEYCGSWIQ